MVAAAVVATTAAPAPAPLCILLTGATGYVGGRLAPMLVAAGHRLRCMSRAPQRLAGRPWGDYEAVPGDMDDVASLTAAMTGCDTAYYLVHSMMEAGDGHFAETDRRFALNFAFAAKEAGTVRRIIYLGGLGDESSGPISPHLRSRQEVGDCLRATGIAVTEFRAAVIVGSGSASFEMIRYLVERLPIMLTPKWVYTKCQPIAVRDILRYLVECLGRPESEGRILEVGGADALPYIDMMKQYAEVRGLRRAMVPVPVLSPGLSARWVHLITPLPASLAGPLIEGLRTEVIVRDPAARSMFGFEPLTYRQAVQAALTRVERDGGGLETSWFDAAYNPEIGNAEGTMFRHREGMIVERRTAWTAASPDDAFAECRELGGIRGWLYWNFLWDVRGWIDRLFGGPGRRRGRRSPTELRVGDAVDFWRVEEYDEPRLLRLRAEMKVPGKAWLQFEVAPQTGPEADGAKPGSCITQTAFFEPYGLLGDIYWYLFYPAHLFIFPGMVRVLARRAEARAKAGPAAIEKSAT